MWKDMLLALFNLIDYNHSGFISRNEFADVIKLILYGENGKGDVNDAYIEELTSAMDFDKNGKIDINEFLGKNELNCCSFSHYKNMSDWFYHRFFRKFSNCQR